MDATIARMRREGLEAEKDLDSAKVAALRLRGQLAFNALYEALRDHLGDDIPQQALEAMTQSISEKLAVRKYVVVALDHVDVARATAPTSPSRQPGE